MIEMKIMATAIIICTISLMMILVYANKKLLIHRAMTVFVWASGIAIVLSLLSIIWNG